MCFFSNSACSMWSFFYAERCLSDVKKSISDWVIEIKCLCFQAASLAMVQYPIMNSQVDANCENITYRVSFYSLFFLFIVFFLWYFDHTILQYSNFQELLVVLFCNEFISYFYGTIFFHLKWLSFNKNG